MTRRSIVILTCCFFSATALVIGLYAATYKIVHERNSFLREYQKFAAIEANEIDIGVNSWYIAGATADHVYLGNITAPFNLLITNNTLTDSQRVRLRIKGVKNPKVHKSATVKIDSPYFYLADGLKPILYRGNLGEWEAEPIGYDSNAYFTQLIPISNYTFGIRTNQSQSLDNILGKVQTDTPRIQLNAGLLQKQIDGLFCTDGILQYNKEIKRLIYTYYYRNEFIVYDTNLNLDYHGHTIDTISRAQIKVGYVNSGNRKKLMQKKTVNVRSWTSGRNLFILSDLLAKNDIKDWFSRQSVIDVYNLSDNNYSFSFSIPNHDGKRVREFMVYDNKFLIALYDHYMVKYDLSRHYFIE